MGRFCDTIAARLWRRAAVMAVRMRAVGPPMSARAAWKHPLGFHRGRNVMDPDTPAY
jgi:hypothetical protein